jgi:Ran GTPase-activating protein (RanGAP) involved in mRNA processing and transport
MFFSICSRVKESFHSRAIIEDIHKIDESSFEEMTDASYSEEWLESTCRGLQCNDPDIRHVEIDPGKNSFDDEAVMALSDSLRKNTVVARLVLRNVDIGKGGPMYLTPMLKNTKSIRALHLEDVRGKGHIAVAMALSLNSMSSIETLHLKGNHVDLQSAEALGLMLTMNCSLTELRLCHNIIDPECVSSLAHGLKKNRGLKILDLLGNGLGDVAVSKIAGALACNNTLEVLCLDFNEFGSPGVQAIADMLRHNEGLEELHLFGNRIDATGARSLADALCHNKTLKILILSFNQIGDDGAAALARALTVNTSLTKIWFPSNSIGNDGLHAFGENLPRMKGLEQLHVGDFFDNQAAESLLEGLKLNMRLSVLYMESPVYDDEWMDDKLDFYLRLNKCGRSLLQAPDAPATLWPTALARANLNESAENYPDVLYYLLREKPDLFEFRA